MIPDDLFLDLNEAERAVVVEAARIVANRLRKGLAEYGPWRPDADLREYEQEIEEELADGLTYRAMRIVRARYRRRG